MDVWKGRSLGVAAGVLLALVAAIGVAGPAGAAPTCANQVLPPSPSGGAWVCTFDDEFDASTGDATALNTSWWSPQISATSGYTTGPPANPACYVDSTRNIAVANGALRLTVRRESTPFQCGSLTTQYSAGMVSTLSKFTQTYGRFEVRAFIPQTILPGLQETLWLYPQTMAYGPWPASGEVDFAEFYSLYSLFNVPFIHYNYEPSLIDLLTNTNVTTSACPILPGQYNTYAVVWEPARFTISVNGGTCLIDNYKAGGGFWATAPFDQPFFIALTQALGIGTNEFNPLLTPLPASTSIDYVRAWQASAA